MEITNVVDRGGYDNVVPQSRRTFVPAVTWSVVIGVNIWLTRDVIQGEVTSVHLRFSHGLPDRRFLLVDIFK